MSKEWKSNALGLMSIAVSILAFINKEDRLLVSLIFGGAIVFYIIGTFYNEIEDYKNRIEKLEEGIKIQEQLIDIKADIGYLKKEVLKRKWAIKK